MRHRRDYADVSGLLGKPSNVGFLGTEPPALLKPAIINGALIVGLGVFVGYYSVSAVDAFARLVLGHGLS